MMMASPTVVVDLRNSTEEGKLGFRGEHPDPTTTATATTPLPLSSPPPKRKTSSSTAKNTNKASQGGASRLDPLELLLLVIGESSQSGQQAFPSTTLENPVSGFEAPKPTNESMATTERHDGFADEEEDAKQSRINGLRKSRSSKPSSSITMDNNNNNKSNVKRSRGPTRSIQGETPRRELSQKQRSTMLKTRNDTVMSQQHQTSTSRNQDDDAAASSPTPSKRRLENQRGQNPQLADRDGGVHEPAQAERKRERVRSQSTDAQKQPRAPLSPAILSSPQKLRSGRKPVQRSSRVTKSTLPSWEASNLTYSSSFQMVEDSSPALRSIPSVPASSVLTSHQQYHHPMASTPLISGTRKDSVATDVPRRSRSNEPAGQPSYEETTGRPSHNSSVVGLPSLSDDENEVIREIPEENVAEPLEDIITQPSSEPTSAKAKSRRQSLLLSPKYQMKNIASMVAQTSKIIRFKTGGSGTKKLWDSLHDSESWDLSVISNGGLGPTARPVARDTKHEIQEAWNSPSPQFDLIFDAPPEENPSTPNAIQSMSLSAPSLEIDDFPESPPSLTIQSEMSEFHELEHVAGDSPGKKSQRRKGRGGRSRRSRSRSKSKDKNRSFSAPSSHEGRRTRQAKRRDNDQPRETSSRSELRASAAEQHARSRSLSLAGESGRAKTGESPSRQVRRSEKDVQKSTDGTDPGAHKHHHGKGTSSSARHGVRTRTRLPTENSGRNRDRGLLSPPPPGSQGGLNARRRESLLKVLSARTLTKGLEEKTDLDEHDRTNHTTPVTSSSSGLVSRRREGLLKVRSARILREGSRLLDGTTAADEQDRSQRTSRTAGSAATSYGGTVARRREGILRVRSSRALKDEMKLLEGIEEDEINGSHRTSDTSMSGLSKTSRRELHVGPQDLHQHDSSLNMDYSLKSRKDARLSLDPTSLGKNEYDAVAEASLRGVAKQAKMKKKKDEVGKPQESSFSVEMAGSIKMGDMIW